MAVPLMRAYNMVAPVALNTFALAVDNITGLTVQQLNRDNVLLDFVDNPANAAGIEHEARLLVNGLDSGVTFFSTASDPASAGRVVAGPVPITVGAAAGGKQLAYNCTQTAGAVNPFPFIVKYANLF
jgi:hypothetical protein